MPINHPTLVLAKNHAERLHNGGGKDYSGGHGIVVDGEQIKIDTSVVAEQNNIKILTQNLETANENINKNKSDIVGLQTEINQTNSSLVETQNTLSTVEKNLTTTKQELTNTQKDISNVQQTLSAFQIETNQNINDLTITDNNLQNQIDNIKNGNDQINYPITAVNKLGMMKPGQGLTASSDGTVKVNLEGYLDRNSGVLFLNPQESKLVNLKDACTGIYLDFHLVDTVNTAASKLLYLEPGNNKVSGYLIGTFNSTGTAFTVSNSHNTNCMFILWGTNYTQT